MSYVRIFSAEAASVDLSLFSISRKVDMLLFEIIAILVFYAIGWMGVVCERKAKNGL